MKALLDELAARGIRLALDGDRVTFAGPKGAMTPALLRELRERRDEVRGWLLFTRDRAGDGSELALDPERLIAEALEAEGGGGLGPDVADLREALGIYVDSVERDVRPTAIGRVYLRDRLLRTSVVARIRLARVQRPGDRPRRPPLIVCGLPRSGTTLLHRLLALADDAAGIPLWQLVEPMPPASGPDLRRDHAARNVAWMNALAPQPLDAQHYVRPDLPDECAHLLRASFRGSMPWQAPAFGWLEWSLRADALPGYRAWAAFLARLEPAGRRLVLKDPFHAAHLREILTVCPEARFVQTHRDPVEVVPSFHKLCGTMHAVLGSELDRPRAVAAQTGWLEWMVARNAEARAAVPPGRLVDVDYRALVADPLGTVARIHEAFGLPLTDPHVGRIREHLAEHPQRRHGGNPYAASDHGQREDEIAERFAAYRARFGLR